MTPILYDSTETAFESNGLGRLSDATECTVTEERNGQYELEMHYPITGAHYDDIKLGRYISVVPSYGTLAQPFEIYEISKPISGIVTVYGYHISYRLSKIPVMPCSASTCKNALDALVTYSVEDNPFTVWTDKVVKADFVLKHPQSFRACLGGVSGSILDTYGTGEYEWDRYAVKLHLHRGADRGVRIRYGKSLTDLKQEESINNTITGIVPYWSGTVGNKTVTVTLPEKALYSANADKYAYRHTAVVDLTQNIKLGENVTQPTVDVLRSAAKSYMASKELGVPEVNLEVSFVNLADTEEYKALTSERISLCDTVTVQFAQLGVDAKAEVIRTEWNVLADRYNKIELGTARRNISTTLAEAGKTIVEESRRQSQSDIQNAIEAFKNDPNTGFVTTKQLEDKAGEITSTMTTDYLSKEDAKKTYQTEAQVKQTSEEIATTASQKYFDENIGEYATNSYVDQTAEKINQGVSATYQTISGMDDYYTIGETESAIDAKGALSLETPYTVDGTVANFRAVVYKIGKDVTADFSDDQFEWYIKDEDNIDMAVLGKGKTASVDRDKLPYGATVVCKFYVPEEMTLTDRNGNTLTDRNGNTLIAMVG